MSTHVRFSISSRCSDLPAGRRRRANTNQRAMPSDKNASLKNILFTSQQKHMSWVLKRTASTMRFF